MLSLFNSTSILNSFSNTKCAEIYCQTLDHFSIICTFCELKTFEFQDFLLHFKNVHQSQQSLMPEVSIKCESEATLIEPTGKDALEFHELEIKMLTAPAEVKFEDLATSIATEYPWKEEKQQNIGNKSISYSDNSDESSGETYTPKVRFPFNI